MGVGCVPGHQPMSERSLFPAQGARERQAVGRRWCLAPTLHYGGPGFSPPLRFLVLFKLAQKWASLSDCSGKSHTPEPGESEEIWEKRKLMGVSQGPALPPQACAV